MATRNEPQRISIEIALQALHRKTADHMPGPGTGSRGVRLYEAQAEAIREQLRRLSAEEDEGRPEPDRDGLGRGRGELTGEIRASGLTDLGLTETDGTTGVTSVRRREAAAPGPRPRREPALGAARAHTP